MLRGLLGRPLRTGLTILGLALAVPMVVLGLFWWDALNLMIERQFDGIERGDAVVAFTDARSARAEREIARLPGVLATEGLRIVPVRLRAGHRTHLLGLTGLPMGAELRVPRDETMRPIPLPPRGLAMSRRLAEKLAIGPGMVVQVEVLEGARQRYDLSVAVLVDDIIGLSLYMERSSLNRLLREDDLVSHVVLRVDPLEAPALWRHLSDLPRVAVTTVKSVWLRVIDDVIAGMVLASAVVLTGFGVIIAVGIVYNSARVALQERGWEMASLRVLGFTRAEVTLVLLAELAVSIAIAAVLGVPLAHVLVTLLLSLRDNESFSLPVEISAGTFAMAELVVLTAAAASAVVVRQRIGRLDLVGALKARE